MLIMDAGAERKNHKPLRYKGKRGKKGKKLEAFLWGYLKKKKCDKKSARRPS